MRINMKGVLFVGFLTILAVVICSQPMDLGDIENSAETSGMI